MKFVFLILLTIAAKATTASNPFQQINLRQGHTSNLRKVNKNDEVSLKIGVNGEGAPQDTYPWFVSGYNGCGGSLISPHFVITSANCVPYFSHPKFVGIDPLCQGKLNCGQYRVEFSIKNIFINPQYDQITLSHDLALIEIDERSDIVPVELDWSRISEGYTQGERDLFL